MKFTVEKVIRLRQQLASFYILIQKKNYFIDIIYIQILYIYIHIQIYTYIYTNTQTDRQTGRQTGRHIGRMSGDNTEKIWVHRFLAKLKTKEAGGLGEL